MIITTGILTLSLRFQFKKYLDTFSFSAVHPCGRREHIPRRSSASRLRGSSLRAQGTHACSQAWVMSWSGSSLRAQGTLHFQAGIVAQARFIPAGAGNTPAAYATKTHQAVHPCGRREHFITITGHVIEDGSSLRAQGIRCQGSTMFSAMAVHPCGRREHSSSNTAVFFKTGSSLRAQGTLM